MILTNGPADNDAKSTYIFIWLGCVKPRNESSAIEMFYFLLNFHAIFIEKLFLQRYGEQSVRWQLCAPYRCKNKCLEGVCFYSDMEHKSNNMIKNDKIATQLWSFKFRIFLAKTMISKRSKYPFQDFFFFQGLICLVNFYIR